MSLKEIILNENRKIKSLKGIEKCKTLKITGLE